MANHDKVSFKDTSSTGQSKTEILHVFECHEKSYFIYLFEVNFLPWGRKCSLHPLTPLSTGVLN